MIDQDKMGEIIDGYALKFLDDYASTYGLLPDPKLVEAWRLGFINGCQAVSDAMVKNSLMKSNAVKVEACEDCQGKCSVCESKK